MTATENHRARYAALMAEFQGLDREHNASRAREILAEAADLVDQAAEPKKWAALRGLYGQFAEQADPRGAVAAYRDALTVWDREADHDSWLACHSGIGTLLSHLDPFGPAEMEEAIEHLECAVADQPFLAALLAVLYRFRPTGDPYENWRKRVRYLEMDLAQVSREQDPVRWARGQNELGAAWEEEPDADFIQALERRIGCHQSALDALGERRDATWVETCLALSECLLFRGPDRAREHLAGAERYARDALAHCDALGGDLQARALLVLGKVLMAPGGHPEVSAIREAMDHFAAAGRLIDPRTAPALLASVESLSANACLKRIGLGEAGLADALLGHADAALRLLAGEVHLRDRRSLLQVAGEGLLAVADYARAANYLGRAVEAADAALAQAGSRAGRMERIWEFRDSSARLAYCLLRLERTDAALAALDRGKARFWLGEERPWTAGELAGLSACETGMARVTVTPDEFLGFPAAFLHAGTDSVLATLWPVDDAASAVLVGRFYLELCTRRKPPARALRDAQNWMREVSVRELMGLLRELKDEPAPAGPLAARLRTLLRGADPADCPFAEPCFWAAFTVSGKE